MENYLKKELYELVRSDPKIFDFIQEGSLDGVWYWDLEKPENEWMSNKFWTELGYDPDKMPHKADAWQGIINQEDLKIAIENFEKHCADPNHPYDQTVRYTHKNGSIVYIRCRGLAIRNAEGKPLRMLGAHNNITASVALEEERFKKREELWRSTFDNIDIGFQIIDEDFRYVYLNRKTELLSKYPPGKLIGKTMMEMYPGIEQAEVFQAIKTVLRTGERKVISGEFTYENGETVTHINYVQPFDKGVSIVTSDIPEEIKRINRELKESKELYASIFNTAQIPLVVTDNEGYVVEFNDVACQLLEYSPEEYAQLNMSQVDVTRNSPEKIQEIISKLRESGFHTFEANHRTKNGKVLDIIVSASIINIGGVAHNLAVFNDITEIRRYENHLKEKNQELEQFTYLTSHDLQEPIRTLISYSDFLKSRYEDQLDSVGRKSLEFMNSSAKRMQQRIHELLMFSRIGRNRTPEAVDLNQIINDIKSDLKKQLEDASAVVDYNKLPIIIGYKTELYQLFMNLISNAIKYRKSDVSPFIEIKSRKIKGIDSFSVNDNGIGIEPQFHEKIFKIFKRLHSQDEIEGTGIGLAYCEKIVSLHHGQISVESTPGLGSTFKFTLINLEYETED
jgi:two-component system sensor histidine kinase/response regulator